MPTTTQAVEDILDKCAENDVGEEQKLENEEIDVCVEDVEADAFEQVEEETTMPWGALLQVLGIVASDAAALSLIVPMIPEMCRERFGVEEKYVAAASGILLGAFSMAVFGAGFTLGFLSDRIGRRRLILIGLLSGSLGSILFGIAPNFWVALVIRILSGLTNANIALTKALISDIIPAGKNRSVAFAYQGACFSGSRALASAVTGLTFHRTIGISFMDDNPFLFPCVVGSALNFLFFVICLFTLPETHQATAADQKRGFIAGLRVIRRDPLMRKLISIYSITSLSNGTVLVAMIFICTETSLHFGTGEVGLSYFLFGAAAFIFQICCFKPLYSVLHVRRTFLFGVCTIALGSFLLPFMTLVIDLSFSMQEAVVWTILTICSYVMGIGFMTALPMMSTMVTNAADPRRAGLTQGTNQAISSLLRALGPIVSGFIFHFSMQIHFPYLLFWIISALYLGCGAVVLLFNEEECRRTSGERDTEVVSSTKKSEEEELGWPNHGEEMQEIKSTEDSI